VSNDKKSKANPNFGVKRDEIRGEERDDEDLSYPS
jgi:hypothetical protein